MGQKVSCKLRQILTDFRYFFTGIFYGKFVKNNIPPHFNRVATLFFGPRCINAGHTKTHLEVSLRTTDTANSQHCVRQHFPLINCIIVIIIGCRCSVASWSVDGGSRGIRLGDKLVSGVAGAEVEVCETAEIISYHIIC